MGRPSDELAITSLVSRYCQLLDDRRFAELGALHTADAPFEVMGATYRGPAAIQGFLDANVPPEARGRHLCFNTVVTWVDDDHAAAVSDYLVVVPTETGFAIGNPAAVGRYFDEFERTAQGWLFSSRRIAFFGQDAIPV
jgi:3-phenylpropionate/cinnamic acid dioxygenase small subunit